MWQNTNIIYIYTRYTKQRTKDVNVRTYFITHGCSCCIICSYTDLNLKHIHFDYLSVLHYTFHVSTYYCHSYVVYFCSSIHNSITWFRTALNVHVHCMYRFRASHCLMKKNTVHKYKPLHPSGWGTFPAFVVTLPTGETGIADCIINLKAACSCKDCFSWKFRAT